jgi:hypothetical protein
MQRPAYLVNRYESDPCWYIFFYLELPQESNDEVLTFPPGTLYIYCSPLSWLSKNDKHSIFMMCFYGFLRAFSWMPQILWILGIIF